MGKQMVSSLIGYSDVSRFFFVLNDFLISTSDKCPIVGHYAHTPAITDDGWPHNGNLISIRTPKCSLWRL